LEKLEKAADEELKAELKEPRLKELEKVNRITKKESDALDWLHDGTKTPVRGIQDAVTKVVSILTGKGISSGFMGPLYDGDGGILSTFFSEEEGTVKLHHQLDMIDQLFCGAHYLKTHKGGMPHGDIKPANLLVKTGPPFRVLLADFGDCKPLDKMQDDDWSWGTTTSVYVSADDYERWRELKSQGQKLWQKIKTEEETLGEGSATQMREEYAELRKDFKKLLTKRNLFQTATTAIKIITGKRPYHTKKIARTDGKTLSYANFTPDDITNTTEALIAKGIPEDVAKLLVSCLDSDYRSRPAIEKLLPQLREAFGEADPEWTATLPPLLE